MQDKAEIMELFKNLQRGIKKYTVKELNGALQQVLNNVDQEDKQLQITVALNAVCNEYEITRHELIYSTARGDMKQAKNIAYCLLHNELDLPIRYIAKNVFFLKWHNSVGIAIRYSKSLNPNIKPDREFKERMENTKVRMIQMLQSKNKTEKV